MLMHKPLERFYNYFVKIMDRKINKREVKRKKREAELKEIYPNEMEFDENMEKVRKALHLPSGAENPYRFL